MLLTGKIKVEIPEKLKTLFKDSPIVVDADVCGNSIKKDGTLVLGLQCGPDQDLDALLHEMGHFVEIYENRMMTYGWGLEYTSVVEVGGRLYEEPQTTRAIERECRVMAYQVHLKNYLGLPVDLDDTVRSLQLMGDWFLVPSGKFRSTDKINKARWEWCKAKVLENMETLTLEKFFEIWYYRNDILVKRAAKKRHG